MRRVEKRPSDLGWVFPPSIADPRSNERASWTDRTFRHERNFAFAGLLSETLVMQGCARSLHEGSREILFTYLCELGTKSLAPDSLNRHS